jgi:hypothetical protein
MEQALPTRRKVLDLIGEAGVNANGVNRQVELARCKPGEAVALRLEPAGDQGSEITVLSARGVPIGRLTEQYAVMLAPLLAAGRPYRAKLHCLRGGVSDYPSYGAQISIAWDGRPALSHRPLDEAQIRFRRQRQLRVARWRGQSGRISVRLLLFVAGGGLLAFALGWFLALRQSHAWSWICD